MTAGDRQRLIAHLDMTESWLVSELSGLSAGAAGSKDVTRRWSVAEVTEHLAIAEPQDRQQVQDSMKQPATTEKMEATDAAILRYGIDRTNRQKTGEARVPHGTFKTRGRRARSVSQAARDDACEYAQGTSEDLRSRKLAGRKHGRLPVVPDDLDTLAAAHTSDSRDQGCVGISEELEKGRRTGRA